MPSALHKPKRRRRRWLWATLLVIVVGAISLGFYANNQRGDQKNEIESDELDLRLGEAEKADVQVTVNEVGTIEPLVKVDVKSNLSGKVIDLLVREGDRVTKGQVLARVEPDVNQAQTLSEVRSGGNMAKIRAEDARQNLEMNQKLFDEGYLSDQDINDFRLEFDTAMESLEAARTKMRIVEESGIPLDLEISTSQRINIVSPMDGFVIHRNVEVGQTVMSGISSFNEGTIIYTVADLGSMLIEASINEVDIGKVSLDLPVVITVDAFPYREFHGTVTHISPAARLKERIKVFDIEVTLETQISDFRSGMTANIEVRGDKVEEALSVPVEGIFRKEDREVIYKLRDPFGEQEEGKKPPRRTKSGRYDVSETWERFFEEQEVKIGLVSLERAEILEGIEEGAEIALENPTKPRQIEED
jgi:HlyD family secretion protein